MLFAPQRLAHIFIVGHIPQTSSTIFVLLGPPILCYLVPPYCATWSPPVTEWSQSFSKANNSASTSGVGTSTSGVGTSTSGVGTSGDILVGPASQVAQRGKHLHASSSAHVPSDWVDKSEMLPRTPCVQDKVSCLQ